MTLTELLAHIGGVMLDDRSAMLSGASDNLVSDATITRYLNEAQRALCRIAWILEDSATASCSEVTLATDTAEYALHKSVLFVKTARLNDAAVDLTRVGYDDNRFRSIDVTRPPDYWDVNTATTENTGRPTVFSTDSGSRIIRFGRTPSLAENGLKVKLRVVRMPLVELSTATPSASPEVPEEHHMLLATYAAGKCLQSPNIDAEYRAQGKVWLAEFRTEALRANRDRLVAQQSMPQFRFGSTTR
jgi:hypothetical protein